MKESRLFKIVYCLLNQGHTTAVQLADELEVSLRTIYRDLDALSAAGIPIYTETGRNGGIFLMSDFVLDKALLSDAEKKEILVALESMNAVQGINNEAVLRKLSAVFSLDMENWLEVDFSRWGDHDSDNLKFNLLKSAIIQHQAVKIIYANSYGEQYERDIYPLRLYYKARAWYVKAYCPDQKVYRLFKLTRIIECSSLDIKFLDYSFPKCTEKSQNYQTITLCFSKAIAYRVYDEFAITEIERQEDGTLLVTAKMPLDDWLLGFLLSFQDQVDVISPLELKKLLAEQAKIIYEKNKP